MKGEVVKKENNSGTERPKEDKRGACVGGG